MTRRFTKSEILHVAGIHIDRTESGLRVDLPRRSMARWQVEQPRFTRLAQRHMRLFVWALLPLFLTIHCRGTAILSILFGRDSIDLTGGTITRHVSVGPFCSVRLRHSSERVQRLVIAPVSGVLRGSQLADQPPRESPLCDLVLVDDDGQTHLLARSYPRQWLHGAARILAQELSSRLKRPFPLRDQSIDADAARDVPPQDPRADFTLVEEADRLIIQIEKSQPQTSWEAFGVAVAFVSVGLLFLVVSVVSPLSQQSPSNPWYFWAIFGSFGTLAIVIGALALFEQRRPPLSKIEIEMLPDSILIAEWRANAKKESRVFETPNVADIRAGRDVAVTSNGEVAGLYADLVGGGRRLLAYDLPFDLLNRIATILRERYDLPVWKRPVESATSEDYD